NNPSTPSQDGAQKTHHTTTPRTNTGYRHAPHWLLEAHTVEFSRNGREHQPLREETPSRSQPGRSFRIFTTPARPSRPAPGPSPPPGGNPSNLPPNPDHIKSARRRGEIPGDRRSRKHTHAALG